jgi:C1A family cysteine protease
MTQRIYNLKKDKQDLRDKVYRSQHIEGSILPLSVDLRAKMSPIVDQGQLGSCTANAIASGLREYIEQLNGGKLTPLSRLYLYWHERNIEGTAVYESFESAAVARTGKVPLPKRGERVLGGHAVLVVEYKQIGRSLYAIVRNSWGTDWGEKGYFYMPKTFFDKGYVSDMWTGR